MLQPIDNLFAGTTDVNGNYTSPPLTVGVTLWASASVIAQTTGFAAWTAIVGGQAKKFDRGPRADMPIIVRPGQTVVIQVTGAQPLAQVTGIITGIGGDTFVEIAPLASLAANIVAVDTATPRLSLRPQTVATTPANPSFTVASGGLSGAQIFTMSPGCIALRIMATAGGLFFNYQLLVLGRQSNVQYFGQVTSPGSSALVPSPTLPITIPVEQDWDTQVEIHVEQPTQAVNVFISELFDVEAPGQAGASQSVFMPQAAPWQAPLSRPIEIRSAMGSGGTIVLVPAIATATVWCHDFHLITDAAVGAIEWQDTGGTGFAATRLAPAGDNTTGTFGGAPLTKGLGVQINNFSGAAIDVWGHFTYSQQ